MRWVLGLLATFLLVAVSPAQTYRLAWSTFYDDRGGPQAMQSNYFPCKVWPAKDGGAYVVDENLSDFVVSKLDAGGNIAWQSHLGIGRLQYSPDYTLEITQVAEGTTGIYVGGTVERMYPSGPQPFLEKLDFSGQRQFMVFDKVQQSLDCMAVDAQDNVYLSEKNEVANTGGATLTKISSSGKILWLVSSLSSTPSISSPNIAIDRDGNVIYACIVSSNATFNTYTPLVKKFTPTGNLFWQFSPPPSLNYSNLALKVCGDGSMYFLATEGASGTTSIAVRLNSAGSALWSITSDNTAHIAVDRFNNLYLQQFQNVSKYSQSKALVWSKNLGQFELWDCDANGNVVGTIPNTLQQYNSSGQLAWSLPGNFQTFQLQYSRALSSGGVYFTDLGTGNTTKVNYSGAVLWNGPTLSSDREPAAGANGFVDSTGRTVISAGETTYSGWNLAFNSSGSIQFAKNRDVIGGIAQPWITKPMPDGGYIVLSNPDFSHNQQTSNALYRYDANGTLLWSHAGYHYDAAVDASGNIYASGDTFVNYVASTCIYKFDSNGNLLWKIGTANVYLLSIDPSGNLISRNSEICKFSPSGILLWHVPPPNSTTVTAVPDLVHDEFDFDASGNIYETFNGYAAGTTQGWINKLSPSGQVIWIKSLDVGLYSPMFSTVLDNLGNIYSVGETRINGINDMAVFCLDQSSGSTKWTSTPVYGSASCGLFASLDSNKNLVIGGWQHYGSYDYLVVRMNPTGSITGHASYDSGFSMNEQPDGMGLDSSNNVYLFGRAMGPSDTYDFNVAKFLPPVPDDADLVQSVNTPMAAGQSYNVTITATNRGMNTWSGSAYQIDCLEPGTWGSVNIPLPTSPTTAPDKSISLSATITAPTTPGTYALQWQMQHNGTMFGRKSQLINVVVLAQTNFATAAGVNAPSQMVCGQTYPVSVMFNNVGTNTWTTNLGYKVASTNPLNNNIWGTTRLPLSNGPVPGGQVAQFYGNVIAPLTPGFYDLEWRPIQDTTGLPFGPNSGALYVYVTQNANAARFLSQIVPSSISAGADFYAQFTMLNVGTSTWSTSGGYSMKMVTPFGVPTSTWTQKNAYLALGTVPPGAQGTFTIRCTAPLTPGTYNMLSVCDKSGTSFGDNSNFVAINVTPNPDSAQFISQTVPGSMVPGATFNASMTMKNLGANTWGAGYNFISAGTSFGMTSFASPTVAPNSSTTFSGTFTAPSTPGVYNFQWRMTHNGTSFGQPTPVVQIFVSSDAGVYVSRQGPLIIGGGTDFYAQNTMKNVGTTTWTSAAGYSMMTVNPNNNLTWAKNRAYMPANSAVAPGSQAAFTALCTAPATPGTYTMQWQLNNNGVLFGEKSPFLTINVVQSADDAKYLGYDAVTANPPPTTIGHGQTFEVRFNFENVGTAQWTAPDYEVVPTGTSNWGITGIPPNNNFGFKATYTAPLTPGTYTLQMRMWHSGVKFGEPTAVFTIVVT